MLDLITIIRFGWPYLRRYWFRFVLGIAFGFAFGVSNGFTLGGIYLMLGRLGDSSYVQPAVAPAATVQAPAAATPADNPAVDKAAADKAIADKALLDKEAADKGAADKLAADKIAAEKAAALKKPAKVHYTFRAYFAWFEAWFFVILNAMANPGVTFDAWLPRAGRALDWKQIFGGLMIMPLLTAFRGLMGYSTAYLMAWAGQRITNDVKDDVFRKINSLSLDFFHKTTTAELMSRINDDTGSLGSCLRLGLSDLIKEPSTVVVLFLVLLRIDWKLTLISMVFLPLCLVPMNIIRRKIKGQGRADNVSYILQAGLAMESFQNVRVTKAYELADEHAKRFSAIGKRAGFLSLKVVQARATLNPVVETLNSFGMGAVLLYAIWAAIPVKVLGAFLFALIAFFTPVKKLGSIGVYFSTAGMALERMMALLALEPTVREVENALPMKAFTRDIAFRHISFSYGHGNVIEDLSFTLERGQRLGLAGESGSGKSSLLNLLFRFYDPTEGRIEIDGVPIDTLRIADLRYHMALVSQDILLFNATVAENISFGKLGASRDEIIHAAREAHAHDFIEALPEGYDTPLGERGVRLSGGQRQRIAIARAFVRNAPILVLDEATASLDSQSEAEVQKAIDHLAEHRTVICVAHRLSTLRSMDRVIVMQKGRVVEEGSFDELLARNGIFTAMAARQSIHAQEPELAAV